jgi:UDP-glucose 4-epimerase
LRSEDDIVSSDIQKVVVTGASGFIGRHVCRSLAQHGIDVVPLSRSADHSTPTWSLDASVVDNVSRLAGANAVVHLAAFLPVNYEDIDQAVQCYEANSLGTLNLLRAATLAGVQHFVHASTCALYTPSTSSVDECSPTIPQRAISYLASKLAAEVYVSGFSFATPLKTTTLRLASVYGPGMPGAGMVPSCVRNLKTSGSFTVADANRYRTDLVHVLDVVEAIFAVLRRTATGTFNIASGQSVSPLDLATTAARLLGISDQGIEVSPASNNPVPGYTSIDFGKAQKMLGFAPRPLVVGLSNYIESMS